MIVILNGAFGVGKTTVARELVRKIGGSFLFDPEKVGYVLKRLPAFFPFSGRNYDDYQDIPLWRSLNIRLLTFAHRIRGSVVIVPMTFSNLAYLNEFRRALSEKNIEVKHFCLIAQRATVFERLEKRGDDPSSVGCRWIYTRAAYCCRVHLFEDFREQINTEGILPSAVAENILRRLQIPA